jgi:deferrochelatase/peroxidase EfeB
MTSGIDRRSFLTNLVAAGVAAPLAAGAVASVDAAMRDAATPAPSAAPSAQANYPFEGSHQNGILTPAQRNAAFVAFDVTAVGRSGLADLMRTITDRARLLTAGTAPTPLGLSAPPADSGVLGPEPVSDGLTVTASVGASLFDGRYGLQSLKPRKLRRMDEFPNDALDRAVCDGDLLLQICAHNQDTVLHALRDITRSTRGGMQVRWRQDGFISPPRPTGTPRNHLGFKDGTSNPDTTNAREMNQLVWADAAEPSWAAGGTYHVVRSIRMLVEFWDRVNIGEQESMIGRRKDSGAPLTASKEFDDPAYATDPGGDVIPTSAHIRVANPRTPASLATRILRRGYNYDNGTDANGNLNMGLLFVAYNRDLDRQFVAIQKRLADEPLVDYISPFGGGYFFALPGVRSSSDWLGSTLLA